MFWRTLYLDEFQHIRREEKPRQSASRRSGALLSKRDELSKRDRQLSLRTPVLQPVPKLTPESQTDDLKPRKDPAAHVSLSSDAIVKQQGAEAPTSKNQTSRRPAAKA